MTNKSASEKRYYLFLDGFRAFAVLWVIFHHIFVFFDLKPYLGTLYTPVSYIADVGYLGVDIFFVISGFLITGLFIPDFQSQIRVKRFYLRRIFKIIPQYYFLIIIVMVIMKMVPPFHIDHGNVIISSHNEKTTGLSYFLLVQNYFYRTPPLAHLWSIAIEEHFYFLYPILLWLICSIRKEEEARRGLLIKVCVALIVLSVAFRYFSFDPDFVSHSINRRTILFQTTPYRIDALMFGCLLKVIEPHVYKISRPMWQILSSFCCLTGLLIYVKFIRDGFYLEGWISYVYAYVAAGLLMVSALMGFRPLIFLSEANVVRWVGRKSYGIYLWHYPIIFLFVKLSLRTGVGAAIIMYVTACIFMGAITTDTLERYFLNVRKKVAP